MKTLKIYSQMITNTHEEIEVYKRLLSLCGIKFEEVSPLINVSQRNIKLRDISMCARMYNVLKHNIENFFDITVEEFVSMYPRHNVFKWRNLGKGSISELSKELGLYGYAW